jgi:hypothetical protein
MRDITQGLAIMNIQNSKKIRPGPAEAFVVVSEEMGKWPVSGALFHFFTQAFTRLKLDDL